MAPARRGDTRRVWLGRFVRSAVDRADGNKAEACRRLGIRFHTLQRHLRTRVPAITPQPPVTR